MSDERLKKNVNAGRENRAKDDLQRRGPEEHMVSSEERRRMFRSEWLQEALPKPPDLPGFHLCWLSTTNQYDPIHKRLRMGYEPVKANEMPGFENYKVKSGELEGFISCNEMVLYKMPMDVYQDIMAEMHHFAPLEEAEKIKVQQEMLMEQSKADGQGQSLVTIEGSVDTNRNLKVPTFS